MDVGVLATWNRRPVEPPVAVPRNARLVDWISYARTMPRCDAVVCHGGHGTLVRALACGVPVVACPPGGHLARNASGLAGAGAGGLLPRPVGSPPGARLAVRA